MSTEQKKRSDDEAGVVEEEIEMEEKNAFQLPDNAFEYDGGDCCCYDDDSSDGDDDYDDEPKPKAEPELWVVRKYNKDCVNDRFRDYFMLDCDYDFVIPYNSVMDPSRHHVYDYSPSASATDGGSYLSAIVDGGPDAVLPPCLQLESATSASTS